MTGIKINVGANVAGVTSELSKVEEAAKRINATLGSGQVGIDTSAAKRDLDALEAAAASLSDQLDRARSGGGLEGLNAGDAAKALQEAAKAAGQLEAVLNQAGGASSGLSRAASTAASLEQHFSRARRAQEVLAREGVKLSQQQAEAAKRSFDQWRRSGARGTGRIRDTEFDDWVAGGWRSHSMDEREAQRHRDSILRTLGVGRGPGGGRWRIPGFGRGAGAAAGAMGGMAAGMLGGGDGGLWGTAGNAGGAVLGAGAGMLLGGPIGAVIGAFATQLLGGVGRAIDAKMSAVGDEGGIYTDLRRAIGVTANEFEDLRGSVRHFTDGLGLAYNEAAALAKEFGRTANLRGEQGGQIGPELENAVGFARGFGGDPRAATQFMASMRHLGVSGNERDSKRLAVLIGEAVQKGGTTARLDEVLSALQSQATMQARASLSSPDLGAYASFMSSLTGLDMYGMKGDPSSAASAMGAADQAMRRGGAFGEASKNFSLALWQRNLNGFSAFDMDYLNEQGAFGNVEKAFGRDSAAYKFAASRGDRAKMAQYDEWAAAGGGRSVMAMQMQALERQYGINTDEFRKGIMSHFGVGGSQAVALHEAYKNDRGLGSLERALSDAGVDVSKLNTKQIAALSEVATGDRGALVRQAQRLSGLSGADKLKAGDSAALSQALSGDDDTLRKVVTRLTAQYDSARDQGEEMRNQQASMSNAMQELATKLVPATIAIKDGIIELVRRFAGDSEFVRRMDRENATGRAAADGVALTSGQAADAYGRVAALRDKLKNTSDPSERKKIERDLDEATREFDKEQAAGARRTSSGKVGGGAALSPEHRAYLLETDRLMGDKPGTAEAQLRVESRMDPNAVSPAGARGYAQLMPKTIASLEKRWGRKLDPSSLDDAMRAQRELMLENKARFGNGDDARRAYNGGWLEKRPDGTFDRSKWDNPETSAYNDKIRAARGALDVPDGKVPEGAAAAQAPGGVQAVSFRSEVTIRDQQGREVADPIIQTSFGRPRPAGFSFA